MAVLNYLLVYEAFKNTNDLLRGRSTMLQFTNLSTLLLLTMGNNKTAHDLYDKCNDIRDLCSTMKELENSNSMHSFLLDRCTHLQKVCSVKVTSKLLMVPESELQLNESSQSPDFSAFLGDFLQAYTIQTVVIFVTPFDGNKNWLDNYIIKIINF